MDIPNGETAPLQPELAPRVVAALEKADHLNEQILAFVRERPLTCIAGAVVLGFVVGKIAARY